jgi:membrane fusion protein, copper/silver efflux system
MNRPNEIKTYKTAFILSLLVTLALASVLGWIWIKPRTPEATQKTAAAAPVSETLAPNAQPDIPTGPVQLTPERMQAIGVRLGKAEMQDVTDEIRAAGNVEVDERRIAYVHTRFPGWIRNVYADATYQFVHKDQPLFTIYSPDLVTTEQEYLLAKKNAEKMQSSTVSGVAAGSESLLSAARQRLEQWEVPSSEVAKLESTGKVITDLTFNSPVSGYITERNALPNMYVQPETRLYTVADLSSVWVYAQVFQTDLGKIAPGNSAIVTVDAYPGKSFAGRVDQILPQVDMNTRTVRVRLVFTNAELKLKPGMYVNVTLRRPIGRRLVVPSSAVLQAGTRQLVFVSQGEGMFQPREVQTAELAGDKTVISRGLKNGDMVVTSANFLIDSESQLQAAAGAFVPPPPGAGMAAAMNDAGSTQVHLELTTEPTPPRKGKNIFRVKLTDAQGSPIDGAQVSVTFYMPAMPAMGMAAMKGSPQLSAKDGGIYEGTGELGSGGSWQVTLTASRGGKIIGTRHFTLNAAGGM